MEAEVKQGLPEPEGARATGPAADGPPPAPMVGAGTLAERTVEYSFFNHGVFLTVGNLDVDPVEDYWAASGLPADEVPQLYEGPALLFDGIDNDWTPSADRPHWGRVLLAVRNEFWPGLFRHLCAAAAVDRKRRRFWRSLQQTFVIADPSQTGNKQATLPVTLFGLDGSFGRRQFVQYVAHADYPIQLISLAPDPETVKFARAVLGEENRPYQTVENGARRV